VTQQAATTLVDGTDVLAASVRRLIEASVTTLVDEQSVLAAARSIDLVTASLEAEVREGRWVPDRRHPKASPYNTVVGTGNPIAPPVLLTRVDPDGVTGEVTFPTAYEGAPGLVHGGILSLVLDQVFGEAAIAAGLGSMTVSLEVRYKAPTPIHQPLVFEAHVAEAGERLVRLEGSVRHGDVTTVTSQATFFRLTAEHARRIFGHLDGP
jgi:acyl-coenzyme A thioesterase PaaI-like protein